MRKWILLFLLLSTSILYSQDFWSEVEMPLGSPFSKYVVNSEGDLFTIVGNNTFYQFKYSEAEWVKIMDGLPEFENKRIMVYMTKEDIIYFTIDEDTYILEKGSQKWVQRSNDLKYFRFLSDLGSNVWFGSVQVEEQEDFSIALSYDKGLTWNYIDNPIEPETEIFKEMLYVDSKFILRVYVKGEFSNSEQQYISFDSCKTWQIFCKDFKDSVAVGVQSEANLLMDDEENLFMSVNTKDDKISFYKSTDVGLTWELLCDLTTDPDDNSGWSGLNIFRIEPKKFLFVTGFDKTITNYSDEYDCVTQFGNLKLSTWHKILWDGNKQYYLFVNSYTSSVCYSLDNELSIWRNISPGISSSYWEDFWIDEHKRITLLAISNQLVTANESEKYSIIEKPDSMRFNNERILRRNLVVEDGIYYALMKNHYNDSTSFWKYEHDK